MRKLIYCLSFLCCTYFSIIEAASFSYESVLPVQAISGPVDSLTIKFSSVVQAGRGKVQILNQNRAIVDTIDVGQARLTEESGKTQAIIPLTRPLKDFGAYTISLEPGLFVTQTGDSFVATQDWSFQINDPTPLRVVQLAPNLSATQVKLQPQFGIEFSKAMKVEPGKTIWLKDYNTQAVVSTIRSEQTNPIGYWVLFQFPERMALGKRYFVEIESGAFKAQNGSESYAGIQGTQTWNFSTEQVASSLGVVRLTPTQGAINFSPNTTISVLFNQAFQLKDTQIKISDINSSQHILSTLQINPKNRNELLIVPKSALRPNTNYKIELGDAVQDTAGIPFKGLFNWTFYTGVIDKTAPKLINSEINFNNSIILTYDKELNERHTPYREAYKVIVNGEKRPLDSISVIGKQVCIYLESGIAVGQMVQVSYQPTYIFVQDEVGNRAPSFLDMKIDNTVDTILTKFRDGSVSGKNVVLRFSQVLKNISNVEVQNHVEITADSEKKGIANAHFNGNSLYITLETEVLNGQVVRVSYTPSATPIKDIRDNPIAKIDNRFIRNYRDTEPPKFQRATVSDRKLTIYYNEGLLTYNMPMRSHYSVLVDRVARFVEKVEIIDEKVELTLASPVRENQVVTLSYIPGYPRVVDFAGNAAGSLEMAKVENITNKDLPKLESAYYLDQYITLGFSKALHAASGVLPSQFKVRVDGSNRTITDVKMLDMGIQLALSDPIGQARRVEVSYFPGNNPLMDDTDRKLGSVTNFKVQASDGVGLNSVSNELELVSNQDLPSYYRFREQSYTTTMTLETGKPVKKVEISEESLRKAFQFLLSQTGLDQKLLVVQLSKNDANGIVVFPTIFTQAQYSKIKIGVQLGDALGILNTNQLNLSFPKLAVYAKSQSYANGANFSMQQNQITALSPSYQFNVHNALNMQEELNLRLDIKFLVKNNWNSASTIARLEQYSDLYHVPTLIQKNDSRSQLLSVKGESNDRYMAVTRNKSYKDLNKHWSTKELQPLIDTLVVDGKTQDLFEPNVAITRAEFAMIVCQGLGLKPDQRSANQYYDVQGQDKEAGYVGAASASGIVNGIGNGKFAPKLLITREQLALMMVRAAEKFGPLINMTQNPNLILQNYKDLKKISIAARSAVAKAQYMGVVKGATPTKFNPKGTATRAEAALMLKRMLVAQKILNF